MISAFIQTTVRTDIDKIDSASDPDQEYTYLMGSETIDSASDPDQEYIYSTRLVILIKNIYPSACNILMGSETLPSAGYILLDESSIPFYSTSNAWLDRLG